MGRTKDENARPMSQSDEIVLLKRDGSINYLDNSQR